MLAILFLASFKGVCFAQPTVIGTDILLGPPNYVTYGLNAVGGFKQFRIQATNPAVAGSIQWQFTQGTAAVPDYNNKWMPYSGSCNGNPNVQIAGYNTFIAPATVPYPSTTASATYSGAGGCPGFLPAVTAGLYYTFNVTNNAPNLNNNMSVLETVYNPATISTVTRNPATVGGTVSPVITVVMSAAPSAGEYVYVRYSTDNFATSTLAELSFVGVTGTVSIPVLPAGANVTYYVYSSPKTSAQIGTDVGTYGQSAHDMATLNVNNNGGSNYSYTVLPVTVNATNAGNDASYNTLKAAFDAINLGTHTGTINIWISGNTNEGALSAVLNASGAPSSYTSVMVRPSGLSRTVSGNPAGPLIDLNGADNVTIDGLNDGSNSLTISNSNSGATAGTSTIRMYNSATANTVQNCILEGSATTATGGIVFFSTGLLNTNILINSNTLRPAGSNLPLYAVCGSGTANTAITISNNNIQDYFSAAQNSFGVFASTGSNAWTISNNRFYQTVPRTINTAAAGVRGIIITEGGGYMITNNVIGFSNSGGTGTTTYTTTQPNNLIIGIQLTGNTTSSTIQGNVISNITLNTASNTTTVPGIFTGIYVSAGAVNISTNSIGSAAGTGSINITCSVTGTQLLATGITVSSLAPNAVNIQNNTVGSFSLTATPVSAFVQCNFNGIFVPSGSTANYSIADNLIGSTGTASSVNIGVSSTGFINFAGINSVTTGTVSATGNTIQNCTQSSTGASTVTGIAVTNATGVLSITNNNIIACSNAGTGAFTAINNTSAVTTLTISGNIIRNNIISTATGAFTGIVNSGAVTSAITINNNQLGNATGGLVTFSGPLNSNNPLLGISNTGGTAAAVLTIQSNDFRGITYTNAGVGTNTYIINSATTLSQNISTNTFTALSINSTGPVFFISNNVSLGATGSKIINDNVVVTSYTKAIGAAGVSYFYYDLGTSVAGSTITNDGNNFSNVTIANPLIGWNNQDGNGTAPTKNITNNTFNNITGNGGQLIIVMQVSKGTGNISNNSITNSSNNFNLTALTVTLGSFNIHTNNVNTITATTTGTTGVFGISIANGTAHNVYNNTVHTISSSVAAHLVMGISVTFGTTINVYKNKVYGISNTFNPLVSGGAYGISITGGTTVTVSNNLVGNISAPSANFDDAIRGLSITGGSTVNAYYNTVYINTAGTGASFGSSALYASNTPVLDLRNNILHNISVPGSGASGKTVAYRRSTATLTNYANSSDNNLFYAGTPGVKNLIYYDGTGDQTLGAYQTRVGTTRDTSSVSASLATNFVSTVGSSISFLHLNGTSAAESTAETIAGFTTDYDDEIRFGNVGYTGTGTRTDIGADEFESVICPAVPTITGISSAAPYYAGDIITITGTNLTGITYATINDINATIGTVTATTAQLTIPVTMADSVGVIQVAFSSSCTFSNTFNFVFAGYITKGAGLGNGTWGTASIWRNNALPVNNAPAIINSGDTVTLNISADPIKFTILSGAVFTQQNNTVVFGNTFLNNTLKSMVWFFSSIT